MTGSYLRIVVIAFSLGLDVFAVSVGVGVGGATFWQKVRIGAAFVVAEVGMTVAGVAIGNVVDRWLGPAAGYVGYAALCALGVYMIAEAVRETESKIDLSTGLGLIVASLSVSLDSLGIGFSIASLAVPLALSLATIAATTVLSTTLGLALGKMLGVRVGESSGVIAGIVLALTGMGFAWLRYTGGG